MKVIRVPAGTSRLPSFHLTTLLVTLTLTHFVLMMMMMFTIKLIIDEEKKPLLLASLVKNRAGKSKSLIRWKRLKGGKRRKKAEKANLIYN